MVGTTEYTRNYEDLCYYIGSVKNAREATEKFNQKYGSIVASSATIDDFLSFCETETSDFEVLPLSHTQDDFKILSQDSTFPPSELGWDIQKPDEEEEEESFFVSIPMINSSFASISNTNQGTEPDSSQQNSFVNNPEYQSIQEWSLPELEVFHSSLLIEEDHWEEKYTNLEKIQ
jgi:hypothetical protein